MKHFVIGFYILLCAAFLYACKPKEYVTKVERACYYWKNTEDKFSEKELDYLQKDSIDKLYVKFFEVETNPDYGIIPTVKSVLGLNYWDYKNGDSLYGEKFKHLNIIPTVYIRNAVFTDISKGAMDTLADNIIFLTTKHFNEYIRSTGLPFSEIHIDCDWTPTTRDNYFYFLKKLKTLAKKSISATLRLYPYKYPDKMGILPVDKAMLMCYNLNNPLSDSEENSILESTVLEKYLKGTKKYPVHLDVALPIFNWMLWYRNNVFSGIIYTSQSDLLKDSLVQQIRPNWYALKKDIMLTDNNLFLKAGDKFKIETVNEETIHRSISLIQQHVIFDDSTTVSLFHLDTKQLEKYSHETITSFYTDFTK